MITLKRNLKSLVLKEIRHYNRKKKKKDVEETESLNPEEKTFKEDMAIYADTLNKEV